MRVSEPGGKIRGEVFNNTNYALVVHEGSGPHVIRARKGKALKFEVGGRTVFAASVRHPGTKPRPWLAESLRGTLSTGDGWRVVIGRGAFNEGGFDDSFNL